jgi:hypothetical protein
VLFAAQSGPPAVVVMSKGHGRLERRAIRASADLAGYSLLP